MGSPVSARNAGPNRRAALDLCASIRRLWCAVSASHKEVLLRQAVLRMYWDNERTPSVEVPLGDFFGSSWGRTKDYMSTTMEHTSGGYNCYWPMPFNKAARVELFNDSDIAIEKFYFNSDIEMMAEPTNTERLYFHAQWRRENPTATGKLYTVLEAKGRGKYVGTSLQMQSLQGPGLGFLEGDEEIFVDGESLPGIHGTGTEDYFMACWYFETGEFAAPFHGCLYKNEKEGRAHAYRWHVLDAIPFQKSLLFQIEHGPSPISCGKCDYVSTAYWYQTEPHAPFPPLPPRHQRLPVAPVIPSQIPGAIEAEDLIAIAKVTQGTPRKRYTGEWGNEWSNGADLFWSGAEPGGQLKLSLKAPAAGRYKLAVWLMLARNHGDLQFYANGKKIGDPVSGYSPILRHSDGVELGVVDLQAGANELVVEITGKAAKAIGYLAGIDCFRLEPVR